MKQNYIDSLKEIDYVKIGENVIDFTATTVAIIVGVVSYAYTAFQLWWDDNGESTQVNLIRFFVNLIDFIAEIVLAIPKIYRWTSFNTNRLIDSLYYQVALG